MDNQLKLINEEAYIEALGTERKLVYCSFPADTYEEKAKLYKAANSPDFSVADVINQEIMLKDIYCEVAQVTNKKTGEVSQVPRIVLIDAEGKSYACLSSGIYNAVRKLIQCFGTPTWEQPIKVKVQQINKGQNRIYTLAVC